MISFLNDYDRGAHALILDRLIQENGVPRSGYGLDDLTEKAEEAILSHMGNPDADIHFVTGGTMANVLVISSMLKPYEAVISCDSGHINVNETGAVEYSGHKILTRPNPEGKVTPEMIEDILKEHTSEHHVKPALVYISQTTEVGTLYSYYELEMLSYTCQQHGLKLFMDGARLGSALTAEENDLKLDYIPHLVDAFTIGGTKNGALFGEAVVVMDEALKEDFRYQIKNRGFLLAKGFLLGLQFLTLFEGHLYFDMAKHANVMAQKLAEAFRANGWKEIYPFVSNQLFVGVTPEIAEAFAEDFAFEVQQDGDELKVLRLVTSWATTDEDVKKAIDFIEAHKM